VEILKRLRESVRTKRPEFRPTDGILHHDNAPAHKALSAEQFLAQKSTTEKQLPPSSLDLAANDLWLFTEIKSALKGRRFQIIKDIKKVTTILQQQFQKRSNSGSNVGLCA
jgi:hypothetical protein